NIQKILWQLGERCKLTPDEEKQILPYLNHSDSDIFSAAVKSLKNSKNEEIIVNLKSKIYGNNIFRATRVATALYEVHKDTSGYNFLKEKLLSEKTALHYRRELARDFILFKPAKDIINAYLNLLSDANVWIRYNAINILKKETGNIFDYQYRKGNKSNKDSINKWKDWWQKEKENFQFKNMPFRPIAGIGVVLDISQPFIAKVLPNLGADKSGLKRGDTILEVDGDSTKGKFPWEVALYEVLGEEGTFVNLKIKYAETGKIKEVKIKREILKFNK
ncbi:MAG: PDZ domain-containing protein, partial [Elusimicrobiota bacterium]|nr:PDZ domain-containing protein [Elusimicrobiota bacterium]